MDNDKVKLLKDTSKKIGLTKEGSHNPANLPPKSHKIRNIALFIFFGYIILNVIGIILTFINVNFIILEFLIFILGMPLFLISIITLIVKLYFKRKIIKETIVVKVTKNFIIANFFIQNRRIHKEAFQINEDGMTFDAYNGIYTIDEGCVWMDDDNRPNSYYIFGFPNPLKFGFESNIKAYLDKIRDFAKKAFIETGNTHILDIAYSAVGLKLFKKDKFLNELHNPEKKDNTISLIIIFFIVLIVIILLMLIFLKPGTPTTQVILNNITR